MNEYRNFTCGQLRAADAGKRVRLAGWVHRKRNLGNLCFVDLRACLTAPRRCLRKCRGSGLNR